MPYGNRALNRGAMDLGAAFANAGRKSNDLGDMFKAYYHQQQGNKAGSEAQLNQLRLQDRMGGANTFIGGQTGLPNPQVGDLVQYWNTGSWGTEFGEGPPMPAAGPPTRGGEVPMEYPVMEAEQPQWFTPDVAQKANQARSVTGLNRMATGETNAEELSRALGNLLMQSYQQAIAGGDPQAQQYKEAIAAGRGEPSVDVTSSGIGFERYGDLGQAFDTAAFDRANKLEAQSARNKATTAYEADVDAARIKADADRDVARMKGAEKTTSTKSKYDELIGMGVEPEIAQGVVYGLYKQLKDPVSGSTVLVDIATGKEVGRMVPVDPANPFGAQRWVSGEPPAMTYDQAFEVATEQAKERNPFGPDFLRPEATRKAYGGLSQEDWIKQQTQTLMAGDTDLGAAIPQQPGTDAPPMQGARRGKDGNWYIQQNGQWFRVDQ